MDVDPAGAARSLAAVAAALPAGRRIQVGAEDAARTDAVLGCVLDVAGRVSRGGWVPRCRPTSCAPPATPTRSWRPGCTSALLLLALGPVPVEQLMGVRPDVLRELPDRGVPTRVYVPCRPSWFRYWMRRVAESRGA